MYGSTPFRCIRSTPRSTAPKFGSTRKVFTVSPLQQSSTSTDLMTAYRNVVAAERAAFGNDWQEYTDAERGALTMRRKTLATALKLRS